MSKKPSPKKQQQADAEQTSAPAQPVIVAYKGFGIDWKCRDQQYAVGQTYEMPGPVSACERGFHACEYPLDVLSYYPAAGSRFAVVEQSGEIGRHDGDTKIASSRIHVKAEIDFAGLIKAAVDWTFSRAKPIDPESPAQADDEQGHASATGYSGAASATGDSGAASATGYRGAASATGDRGAASATGEHATAMACGYAGRAMAAEGCAIFLAERDFDTNAILSVFAGIAGRDGIKPHVWYTLQSGQPVEVTA